MAILRDEEVLARTVVDFSRDGVFPEEDNVSAILVQSLALPGALSALASAKDDLESEIRKISTESAPEVDSWISHAKAVQEDIERSRNLASEIVRLAQAGESKHASLKDSNDRLEFLSKEVTYCKQVGDALRGIRNVRDLLDQAEQAAVERNILPALHILSDAWDIIYKIPTNGRTRAIRLLDDRAFALRASIHENFDVAWDAMVHVNVDVGCITIKNKLEVDAIDIIGAIITMKAYGELDERVRNFSRSLEDVIIRPCFDLKAGTLASIDIIDNTIRTSSTPAEHTIKSLLNDLEKTIRFLSGHLPLEFTQPLSDILMPKLCSQIKETWLDSAVPTSLQDMTAFRKAIALVQVFANNLNTLHWTGGDELLDWVANAPRIWLTKRRETALDWTRNQLSLGIGSTRKVDRVETQTLSHSEGKHITFNGNGNGNDWDAAWSDDEQEEQLLANEKHKSADYVSKTRPDSWHNSNSSENRQEDDPIDAWGWGDDETGDVLTTTADDKAAPGHTEDLVHDRLADTVREVTLTEKYTISSMPDPVYSTIKSIVEDGATLTREIDEQNPVAAAATGLFALPALILAMYRAVSPYYYGLSSGGNMYLYNDALWLAEQLQGFNKNWAMREDLGPRVSGKVRLDNEVEMLQIFGKRAYSIEISTQRTILNDLLGGAENFLLQDGQNPAEDEAAIESIVSHIQTVSAEWKQILSKSTWAQATGSLLSTVAKKIILDVDELTSLGADEAYRVANLISKIVKLDELFLPETKDQPQIPVTSQYAPHWLKLHFLSEVLQSDLKDVKYLWFESDLSLYFTAKEVVDLIELSFENNFRTREAIANIMENPEPRGRVLKTCNSSPSTIA